MGAPLWLCEGSPQPAGAFANSFHGIRRRLLHLSVDILRCTFHLFCLALELTFYVAGSFPTSLIAPAADGFRMTSEEHALVSPACTVRASRLALEETRRRPRERDRRS